MRNRRYISSSERIARRNRSARRAVAKEILFYMSFPVAAYIAVTLTSFILDRML